MLEATPGPLDINGTTYMYSGEAVSLAYKGKRYNTTIYYKRQLGKFNKSDVRKIIDMGGSDVLQSHANNLPSKPDLIIFDGNTMRLVYNDFSKVSGPVISKK